MRSRAATTPPGPAIKIKSAASATVPFADATLLSVNSADPRVLSVFAPEKYSMGDVAAGGSASGGFEDAEDSDRAAELAQSPAIGGDMLAMEGSHTQKTPELIERTTKSSGRGAADQKHLGEIA